MTYTRHKLTSHQLERLSAIVAGKWPHKGGVALLALYRRGLVAPTQLTVFGEPHMNAPWRATGEGKHALQRARQEGW